MKKAVIETGGKQYLVKEDETLTVEKLTGDKKQVSFKPLLVIEDNKTVIGTPLIDGSTVLADIVEAEVKDDKVVAIRYKAKKRVRKVKGHRQIKSLIKISKIS